MVEFRVNSDFHISLFIGLSREDRRQKKTFIGVL